MKLLSKCKNLKDVEVLITMYDGRANHCKEVAEMLEENIILFLITLKPALNLKM
jgi:chromosome partitioning protein